MKEKSDQRIRIAFLQLLPGKTLEEQLEIGQKACREAKEKGADIALFPEMWSDGYFLPQDEQKLKKPFDPQGQRLCSIVPAAGPGAPHGHRDHVSRSV